ncbi:MAG: hypothetical protein J6Z45_03640 [Oscillospiraceae bacterium]|nr:hypothetical protein [Oscillospiraceae bacterium]
MKGMIKEEEPKNKRLYVKLTAALIATVCAAAAGFGAVLPAPASAEKCGVHPNGAVLIMRRSQES